MTTTEWIEELKRLEFGASGRPREVDFWGKDGKLIFDQFSTGDGCAGAELGIHLKYIEE